MIDSVEGPAVLDTKWKQIDTNDADPKHGILQNDLYQLYAYARAYECQRVALVYPRNQNFTYPLLYRFFDELELICLPFDVQDPERSVTESLQNLRSTTN